MPSAVQVFNQYYWDLLKRIKDLAKDLKHRADDKGARDVLREIKRYYMSFDKGSEDHVQWYREHAGAVDAYIDSPLASITEWYKDNSVAKVELYKGITMEAITRMFRNPTVILYFLVLLSIFARSELAEEELGVIIELLKNQPWKVEDFDKDALTEGTKTRLKLLSDISRASAGQAGPSGPAPSTGADSLMSELENTSLGRLAKEIMNDVDVDAISKTIGDEGDILKALANPDGGITKLLGTVSQKMISKLASGELKQDTLVNDAMKLANILPGMAGGKGGLGDMTSMMSQVSKMAAMFGGGGAGGGADEEDAGDMAAMMSQFAQMMGGGGGGRGGGRGNAGGSRVSVNRDALNRSVRAKQMRRKLDERRKKHEETP